MTNFVFSFFQSLHPLVWVLIGIAALILVFSRNQVQKAKKAFDQKEENIKKKNENLKFILDHVEEGVIIIQNMTIQYANQKIYEMMGIDSEQGFSWNLKDHIHPDDVKSAIRIYQETMLSKDRAPDLKIRLLKQDKSIFWVDIRSVPLLWEGGPASLSFVRDITAHQMMANDLHQVQRLEAIGVLSGGIAHDFNNILTTIIGNAELALMDLKAEGPEKKKEFEQIRDSGHRARDLVRQILTISREYASEIQPVYLSPIIREGLKLLRATLPKHIKIIDKVDRNVRLVKADSIQIYQVFMNLCTNAKHAMENRETGCLEVELKNIAVNPFARNSSDDLSPGNYVCLSIKDNGPGIDPGIEARIFEPHFSTKDKNKGTGLGLATSLWIIRQTGGQIKLVNTPGEGCSFSVFLPAHEEKREKDISNEIVSPAEGGGKILFVDDEPTITSMAKKMLTNFGFTVMTANSSREALENFARAPEFFDLLITDLSMPDMTGIRLAREVMRIRPGFPVILCTGHSDTIDEKTARDSGIVEYIKKPYNLKQLGTIAAKYIKNSKAA